MKTVSTEELIEHKILPYNLYSESGEKILTAGEVITPGKLLQLKEMKVIYRDDEAQPAAQSADKAEANSQDETKEEPEGPKVIVETFDMKPSSISRNKLSVDEVDIEGYKGPVNKKAKIDPQTQLKIKAFYGQIMEKVGKKPPLEILGMFANIRNKIVQDIIAEIGEVCFSSQLKLLGEYNKCHALNTAILSGAVAKKLDLSENLIYDIVLAGLLHDIGKTKLDPELLLKSNLTNHEQHQIQEHTKIGYKIIRFEMELPETIASVALDHHEYNDGSGYPAGKSGEKINIASRIVNVCNYFDNLTSNRTQHKVNNTKEAMRVMLALGTKKFAAEALYTFVHMFSYNDTMNFEEMIL